MVIKEIKLKNFKNFEKKTVKFDKMVFLCGKNGSGKSTLALHSILFIFWGYTISQSLNDLPTRNIAKSCSGEAEVYHNNKDYKIIRHYPTKLRIFENNEELKFTNSSEAQEFINKTFGTRTYFQKFRIIDAYTKETNFLEEGQTTLKKIIFSISEDTFNKLRKKLNEIKREREIYNKDKAVVYNLYPSTKRLQLISSKLNDMETQERDLKKTIREFETDFRNIERKMGNLEYTKKAIKEKRDKIFSNKKCYACNQSISESQQKSLLSEISKKTVEINTLISKQIKEKESSNEILGSHRKILDEISPHIIILNELKMKLQSRIKQKEYKYTEKDVLIVKKAITEIDRLSTYYLTESVKILEPIINDVLAKIGFRVSFTIDEHNKFIITLQKDGVNYNYKDLSTGEKLILQIGFKLALLMEQGESGIIIADEGMSSLDEDNLNHIIKLFEQLPFQLLFVLHRMRTKICPICDKKFDSSIEECPFCSVDLISLLENVKIIDLNKEE